MLGRTLTLSLTLAMVLGIAGCVIEVKNPGDTATGTTGTTDDTGTTGATDDTGTTGSAYDADGDGYDDINAGGDDCDDADPTVNPGAEEVPYDGVDNDCDAATVDDDLDGDGFTVDSDCDDEDAAAYPGATEICDGVQNDCDTKWTSDDGMVSHDDGAGTWTDLTAAFTGSKEAPADAVIPTDGTVYICAGTYFTNVSFDPAVLSAELVGVDGWETTTLNGGLLAPVLNVETAGQAVSVSGLTLTGGAGAPTDISRSTYMAGAGARCVGEASLTLSGVYITGNSAEIGGGVLAVDGCALTATDSVIDGNTASSDWGGGLALDTSVADLSNVSITNNIANRTGGGVDVFAGSLIMTGGAVEGNHTTQSGGGGLNLSGVSDATLDGVSVSTNTSDNALGGFGGGVSLNESTLTATGGSFDGNSALNGGAVYATSGSAVSLDGAAVSGNAATAGGGLYLSGSSAEVSGGASGSNAATAGGGYLVGTGASLVVAESEQSKNDPDDVQTGVGFGVTGSYDFPGVSSFTCDDQGCVDGVDTGTTGTDTTGTGT